MDCKFVEKILNEYIDDQFSGTFRSQVEAHLYGCQDCTTKLNELKHIVKLVKTVEEIDLPEGFLDRLKSSIQSQELTQKVQRKTGIQKFYVWAGVAAAFLILLGSTVLLIDVNVLHEEPISESVAVMMEEAPETEEQIDDIALNDNAEPTAARAMIVEEEDKAVVQNYALLENRINTDSIELKAKSVVVTTESLRDIAIKHGIEVLDMTCQGIVFKVDAAKREILYEELSALGTIVETGTQVDSEMLSIMVLYGFE